MAKTRITKEEYYALQGLKQQHKKLRDRLDNLEEIARSILGEEDEYGHADDYMWNERELNDLLEVLNIKVYETGHHAHVEYLNTDNVRIPRLENESED